MDIIPGEKVVKCTNKLLEDNKVYTFSRVQQTVLKMFAFCSASVNIHSVDECRIVGNQNEKKLHSFAELEMSMSENQFLLIEKIINILRIACFCLKHAVV